MQAHYNTSWCIAFKPKCIDFIQNCRFPRYHYIQKMAVKSFRKEKRQKAKKVRKSNRGSGSLLKTG